MQMRKLPAKSSKFACNLQVVAGIMQRKQRQNTNRSVPQGRLLRAICFGTTWCQLAFDITTHEHNVPPLLAVPCSSNTALLGVRL